MTISLIQRLSENDSNIREAFDDAKGTDLHSIRMRFARE